MDRWVIIYKYIRDKLSHCEPKFYFSPTFSCVHFFKKKSTQPLVAFLTLFSTSHIALWILSVSIVFNCFLILAIKLFGVLAYDMVLYDICILVVLGRKLTLTDTQQFFFFAFSLPFCNISS
jgi:hypothetical protein